MSLQTAAPDCWPWILHPVQRSDWVTTPPERRCRAPSAGRSSPSKKAAASCAAGPAGRRQPGPLRFPFVSPVLFYFAWSLLLNMACWCQLEPCLSRPAVRPLGRGPSVAGLRLQLGLIHFDTKTRTIAQPDSTGFDRLVDGQACGPFPILHFDAHQIGDGRRYVCRGICVVAYRRNRQIARMGSKRHAQKVGDTPNTAV